MGEKLRQLFQNMSEISVPTGLVPVVLARVEKERQKTLRRQLIWSYIGLAGSFMTSVYAGMIFGAALLRSDFWSMLSLVFSDLTLVAEHWQEFSLSLLDTFPAMSVALVLIPIGALLWSASYYLEVNNHNRHKYI